MAAKTQFALNPAQAISCAIDMSAREGVKFYGRAVKPLDADDLFDARPEDLHRFVLLLNERAREFNWTAVGGILRIPENPDESLMGPHVHLVTHYGERTVKEITAWENTFIATVTRNAQ
jgi:hypothetical protein